VIRAAKKIFAAAMARAKSNRRNRPRCRYVFFCAAINSSGLRSPHRRRSAATASSGPGDAAMRANAQHSEFGPPDRGFARRKIAAMKIFELFVIHDQPMSQIAAPFCVQRATFLKFFWRAPNRRTICDIAVLNFGSDRDERSPQFPDPFTPLPNDAGNFTAPRLQSPRRHPSKTNRSI